MILFDMLFYSLYVLIGLVRDDSYSALSSCVINSGLIAMNLFTICRKILERPISKNNALEILIFVLLCILLFIFLSYRYLNEKKCNKIIEKIENMGSLSIISYFILIGYTIITFYWFEPIGKGRF